MTPRPCRIAVSGKGGTGKTTIASLIIASLKDACQTPILAVDADPNANLNEALGLTVRETLGSMREDAFTKSIPPGMSRTDYVRYRFRQVLVESGGVDLLAMGRPEGSGCYCFANNLLRESMQTLEKEYRFVVVDTEAGMEHFSRGTVGRPDVLLIVSDPGVRGLRTADRIREIAASLGFAESRMFLVFNRYREDAAAVPSVRLRPIAWIPEDPAVLEADLHGMPIADIPATSPARAAARILTDTLLEICGDLTTRE